MRVNFKNSLLTVDAHISRTGSRAMHRCSAKPSAKTTTPSSRERQKTRPDRSYPQRSSTADRRVETGSADEFRGVGMTRQLHAA